MTPKAQSVDTLLRAAARRLGASGAADPRLEARLLLMHALRRSREWLFAHPDVVPAAAETELFQELLARRADGEPLAYIVGRRGFWNLNLRVGPGVLDPRPDSEAVVEAVLASLTDRTSPCRILDLGTGSGCLLLTLLGEMPAAVGVGVDISAAALDFASANAAAHGLASRAYFVRADWDAPLEGCFDIVVANPPYVPTGDIDGLSREVAHYEPRVALDGGGDGLDAYRRIAPALCRLLKSDGRAFLEVGFGQADPVRAILRGAGLESAGAFFDLAGIERCIIAAHENLSAVKPKKWLECGTTATRLDAWSQRLADADGCTPPDESDPDPNDKINSSVAQAGSAKARKKIGLMGRI